MDVSRVANLPIDSLSGLCKDKLFNAGIARFAPETVGMVGFVASHDSLVGDGIAAKGAYIRAIFTAESLVSLPATVPWSVCAHTGDPSARRRRFVSCSTSELHLAQRLQ